MRSGELLGRTLFFKTSIQFRLIPAVMADSVNAASRVCGDKREKHKDVTELGWDGNDKEGKSERSGRDTDGDVSRDNKKENVLQNLRAGVVDADKARQRYSPGSESRSSSPRQTRTLSRRILGQSPRPSRLSTQKTQRRDTFLILRHVCFCLKCFMIWMMN